MSDATVHETGRPQARSRKSIETWAIHGTSATSRYEQRRYGIAMAMLPDLRYRRAFEPGCSIGELTARLAFRADDAAGHGLLADGRRAGAGAMPGPRPRHRSQWASCPAAWPAGAFDLVVLSEIGYYFDRAELRADPVAERRRAPRPAARCWLSTGAAIPGTTCSTATRYTRWPGRWR